MPALVFAFACILLALLTFNAQSAPSAQAALAKTPTATNNPRRTRTLTPTQLLSRTPTTAESLPTLTDTPTDAISPTATASQVPTDTPENTLTPTVTDTELATPVPTVTDTPIAAGTLTQTLVPSDTPPVSETPALTETRTETTAATNTAELSETPTLTAVPTGTPTRPVTPTPTDDTFAGPVTPGALSSTFLIANLDTTTADVTLQVFNGNGAPVYTTTRSIGPNGARAIAMPASVPDGFVGSAMVSSKQKIAAIVLNANLQNSAREMYEGSRVNSNALDFPLFRHLGSAAQKSVIAIQNADPFASASVHFNYYNPDGSEAAGSPIAPVTIAPRAAYYFDSQSLFGSNVVTYSVQVTSTTSIAGAEQFAYLRDTAASAGMDKTQESKHFYLSQVQRGVNDGNLASWSEIYVRNSGALSTTVTIHYYGHEGKLQATERHIVNPNGMIQFDTLGKNTLGSAFYGYAILKQNGTQPLAVQWLNADTQGRQLSAFSALPTSRAAPRWACVDARHMVGGSQYTQFQVLNPGNRAVAVKITLYDDNNGAKQVSQTYKLDSKQRRVIDLSDSPFSVVGTKYRGLAILRASRGAKVVVNALEDYANKNETGYGCVSISP